MAVRVRYARTSDGVDIAFTTVGDGPPLLVVRPLLHAAVDEGWPGSIDAAWLPLAETRSVVMWDFRGMGLSAAPRPEFTIDSSIRDMEAVADALALRRFDVLAFLTPCQTALAFAARYSDRVRRLVLWNPSEPGASPRTSLAALPDIVRDHFPEYIQLAALKLLGWERAASAQRFVERMLAQHTPDTWLRMMESMEAIDATPLAASVVAPTLVITDLSSRPSTESDQQQFMRQLAAMLPNGELVIRRADESRTLAQMLNEFLGSGDSERPAVGGVSGTAVILFADIVDSAGLTERLGDTAFRAKARDLDAALRRVIRERNGTPVDGKLLGDGVLAVFSSASQAIDAALRCGAAGEGVGLQLHMGIHAGDVIREDDNVYGGAVNIAARIAAASAPGEILVSDTVRNLARTSAGATFEDRGEHSLKGIGEPHRLFAVLARG